MQICFSHTSIFMAAPREEEKWSESLLVKWLPNFLVIVRLLFIVLRCVWSPPISPVKLLVASHWHIVCGGGECLAGERPLILVLWRCRFSEGESRRFKEAHRLLFCFALGFDFFPTYLKQLVVVFLLTFRFNFYIVFFCFFRKQFSKL